MVTKLIKKISLLLARPFSSLFGFYFLSFWIVTTLLLSLNTYISYRDTVKSEIKVFNTRVDKTTRHIKRLVDSYNADIDDIYNNIDYTKFDRIIKKARLYSEKPEKITQKILDTISAEEQVIISLIDAKTTKIVASSKKSAIGTITKLKYPGIDKIIFSKLKPGVPSYKITWNSHLLSLDLFARELTLDRRYIWQFVLDKSIKARPVNRLINFFKHAEEFDPLIKRIGMYTRSGSPVHHMGDLKLPTKSLHTKSKECTYLGSCLVWWKTNISHITNKKTAVYHVGIDFHQKILAKRLDQLISRLYKMVVFSLLLSLVISLIITRLFTTSIYRILKFIKRHHDDDGSKEKPPQIYNKELNSLGIAFNLLIEKLKRKKVENRALASKLLNVTDEERRLISRDLHDTIGQLIIAARLKVCENKNEEAKDLLVTASEELRNIYDELEPRSLEQMSLKLAIEWYLFKFFSQEIDYHVDVALAEALPKKMRLVFYRIVQEAIANIKKHSPEAEYIKINTFLAEDNLKLTIANDLPRKAFMQSHKSGRGLINIQLRAESLGGNLSVKKTDKEYMLIITIKAPDELRFFGDK